MLTASAVRMVKGAAASIILLLMTEPRGGNQAWLERYTGYTDKPVNQALAFLLENGMIIRTGDRGEYAYRLAGNAMQLPLPVDQLVEPSGTEPTTNEIESEIFRLDPLASRFNQNQELEESIKPLARAETEPEIFRLNMQALDKAGIREPARSRLARLDHVTPQLIRYHCGAAPNPGLAIYRIEHRWRVPEGWIDPTPDGEYRDAVPQPSDLEPIPGELTIAFEDARNSLAGELSRADYETWVRSIFPAGVDGEILVIGAGNSMAVTWLEMHVKRRFDELMGSPTRFVVRNGSPP